MQVSIGWAIFMLFAGAIFGCVFTAMFSSSAMAEAQQLADWAFGVKDHLQAHIKQAIKNGQVAEAATIQKLLDRL